MFSLVLIQTFGSNSFSRTEQYTKTMFMLLWFVSASAFTWFWYYMHLSTFIILSPSCLALTMYLSQEDHWVRCTIWDPNVIRLYRTVCFINLYWETATRLCSLESHIELTGLLPFHVSFSSVVLILCLLHSVEISFCKYFTSSVVFLKPNSSSNIWYLQIKF